MIGPIMLGHVHERLCAAKNSTEPFGGMVVIISGDFVQLPPICPRTTLFQALVHRHVFEPVGAPALPKGSSLIKFAIDTPAYVGVSLFANFKQHQLTQQMRAADDEVHTGFVNRFRDLSQTPYVTKEVVDHIRVLDREDVEADASWRTAVFVVTTNQERNAINAAQLERFSVANNVPVVRWPLPLSGTTANRLSSDDTVRAYESHPVQLYQSFCEGAPGYLTDNIGSRVGLANGTFVTYHSLTFSSGGNAEAQGLVAAAIADIKAGIGGQTVTLPVAPLSVNVRVPFGDAAVAAWDPALTLVPGSVVVPLVQSAKNQEVVKLAGVFSGSSVTVTPHAVELGFALSIWKCQGRTLSKVVLALNRRPSGTQFNHAGLFVAFSRVKRSADMRRLPGQAADCFDYLLDLKPQWELQCWQAGFDGEGRWSPAAARAAFLATAAIASPLPAKKGGAAARRVSVVRPLNFPVPDDEFDTRQAAGPTAAELAAADRAPLDGLLPADVPARQKNLGNTCWLNSLLQSLAHTPRLVTFLRERVRARSPGQQGVLIQNAMSPPAAGVVGAALRGATLAQFPHVLRVVLDSLLAGSRCDHGVRALIVLLGRLNPVYLRDFRRADASRDGRDWSLPQEDVHECMLTVLNALFERFPADGGLVKVSALTMHAPLAMKVVGVALPVVVDHTCHLYVRDILFISGYAGGGTDRSHV